MIELFFLIEYNLNDYYIASENRIYNKVCNDASCLNFNFRNLRYTSNIYYGSMRGSGGVDVLIKHHIIKNEDYFFFNIGELFSDSYVNVGEKYYDFSDNGGKVNATDESMGMRTLAYEINDETTGAYILMNYAGEASLPAEIDRVAKITDGVLRVLTIRK